METISGKGPIPANVDLLLTETSYLDQVLQYLEEREEYLERNNFKITEYSRELKAAAWEEHLELADQGTNGAIDSAMVQNELAENHHLMLEQAKELRMIPKLRKKPFFGHMRFRFYEDDALSEPEELYIGLKDISDPENFRQLVIDWRAPISTLYYNANELGPASYRNMQQIISGELEAKYQIEIENGKIVRVINTNEQIYDEILQMVLSSVSSAKMKEIVQTLQREQNQIVRAEPNRNLIIQGVAGSGKSSIALHRAAYLMYMDPTMTADNILLITPSESFSNYISSVLPNLGEENVRHMTAHTVLMNEVSDIEGRYLNYAFGQATDEKRKALSGFAWVEWMKDFTAFLTENIFQPKEIDCGNFKIPAQLLRQLYQVNYRHLPAFARQRAILIHIRDLVANHIDYQEAYEELDTALRAMYMFFSIGACFDVFVRWVSEEHGIPSGLFNRDALDDTDLAAMALLKVFMFGASDNHWVRHLIIDEMQDLNAMQHEAMRQIFHCPRTLLGDIHQAVLFPTDSEYLTNLKELYVSDNIRTESYELKKSYRSTKQITEFTRKILQEDSIQALQREGTSVQVDHFTEVDIEGAFKHVYMQLKEWQRKGYRSSALVVKNAEDIPNIRKFLEEQIVGDEDPFVINHYLQEEQTFAVSLCAIREAKGVEFDAVLVWDASQEKYCSDLDRTKLYVACTRALHELTLVSLGQPSNFLPEE